MKQFILFFLNCFICTFVSAHTINWYVGDDVYATTTCDAGDNVMLPTTPTKFGYSFAGWVPVYNRGTFADWDSVPNMADANGYTTDSNDSHIPQEGDYIIVNDATNVPKTEDYVIEIQVSTDKYGMTWYNYCRTIIDGLEYDCNNNQTVFYDNIKFENGVYAAFFGTRWYSNIKEVLYLGTKYSAGSVFLTLSKNTENNGTYKALLVNGYPYSGKWLLRYHGVWGEYRRGGWVAEKRLD